MMASPIQLDPDFLSEIQSYETCLGKGGFGVVLKALDTSNATTAIKFLFHEIDDSSQRQKLLREYNVPKDLEHPNIVKVMNVQPRTFPPDEIEEIFKGLPTLNEQKAQFIARANDQYGKRLASFCIQMELCGKNLRKWLNLEHNANDLHIKIRQTRIIQGMISGLKYLHQNKIMHRDLKPENIMFSKGSYQLPVKIGDFGHSRRIHSEETKTGSLTTGVGTTLYMAPEMHSEDYDQQADLYSLGLIIWEVTQLIEVSKRRNLFDKLVNDKDEDLVQNHSIMTGIKEIIIGLTKRKTSERIKTLNDIHIDNWDQELLVEIQNQDCSSILSCISKSEKYLPVKSSQELKLCLDNAQPGCIINLMNGEYQGPFFLREDSIQIIGSGSGTVLQSDDEKNCLEIVGNGCTISNVKIIRSDSGIILRGSNNMIKGVEFNDMKDAMTIFGAQNTVDAVTMTNLEEVGIVIHSNGNIISNITGLNAKWGIRVAGFNNNLTNINFQRGTGGGSSRGVQFVPGSSYNSVSNLTCIGYSKDKGDWGFEVVLSSNCTIVDSACGPVLVGPSNFVTLRNVDCGEFITIVSGEGLELINCRGKMLKTPKAVKIDNCQFEEEMFFD